MSQIRLLKLARYYEGAHLLALSMAKSASQLLVPMFMLGIMLVCFSAVLVEIEWSVETQQCLDWWREQGVATDFLLKHEAGVTWDCSICAQQQAAPGSTGATAAPTQSAAVGASDSYQQQLCATCVGFPQGHPECLGSRWVQRYPNIPTAMWFMMVTVTPAVALDPEVYPATAQGKAFVSLAIICGVLFLAMPLSTIGTNFNKVCTVAAAVIAWIAGTLSPSRPLALAPSRPRALSPSHPLTLSPSQPLTLSPFNLNLAPTVYPHPHPHPIPAPTPNAGVGGAAAD